MSDEVRGYLRPDGRVGTRNYVAVIASVICSTTPVQAIAAAVPGAIPVVHPLGCAQIGDDLRQTRRVLSGMASNANVSAALIVGLGCENNQADDLARAIDAPIEVEAISIQGLGGTDKVVEAGIRIVSAWAEKAAQTERVPAPVGGLTLGVLGVDWDALADSPVPRALGRLVDRFAAQGARILVGVNTGLEPAGEELAQRARASQAQERLRAMGAACERVVWQEGHRRVRRPWTAEERERARRLAALTGTAPIAAVTPYSQRPDGAGLHLMPVPADPVAAMSALAAGGAAVMVVGTAHGLLAGTVGCPTVVVAPESARGGALAATVDLFVGPGGDAGDELTAAVLAVASGRATLLEEAGMSEFAISQASTAC